MFQLLNKLMPRQYLQPAAAFASQETTVAKLQHRLHSANAFAPPGGNPGVWAGEDFGWSKF